MEPLPTSFRNGVNLPSVGHCVSSDQSAVLMVTVFPFFVQLDEDIIVYQLAQV